MIEVKEFSDKPLKEMTDQELNAREAHLKDYYREMQKEVNKTNDELIEIKIERSKRGANV